MTIILVFGFSVILAIVLHAIFMHSPVEQFQIDRDRRHARIKNDIRVYRRLEWLKQANSDKVEQVMKEEGLL